MGELRASVDEEHEVGGAEGRREPRLAGAAAPTAVEWIEGLDLEAIVRFVACRYHLPQEDSDDLLQETRIALLGHGLDSHLNHTFVFRTAIHKAVDIVRQRLRGDRAAPRKTNSIADEELLHLLRSRLSLLPRPLQVFYALRYEQGLTLSEISGLLGCGRGSVRWMESRTQKLLMHPTRRSPRDHPRPRNF